MAVNFQCPIPSFRIQPEQPPKNRVTRLTDNPSLVYLRLGCPGGCSGVIIGKDLILTSAHCVQGSPFSFVNFSDAKMAIGLAVKVGDWNGDIKDDWAVIRTDTGDRPALKLACSVSFPSEGKDLTCGGKDWPRQQEYPTTAMGIYYEDTWMHKFPYLLFKGPCDHGDSGSPILDKNGDIIGIVSELAPSSPLIGKATALDQLRKALEDVIPLTCPR